MLNPLYKLRHVETFCRQALVENHFTSFHLVWGFSRNCPISRAHTIGAIVAYPSKPNQTMETNARPKLTCMDYHNHTVCDFYHKALDRNDGEPARMMVSVVEGKGPYFKPKTIVERPGSARANPPTPRAKMLLSSFASPGHTLRPTWTSPSTQNNGR